MSIYKRASGRWAVLVDVDRGANGKRARRALGTYATRKAAERAERQALTARDNGHDLAPQTTTVATLMERYLRDARTRIGERTVFGYEAIAKRYILPTLGTIALAKLKPAHVSALYAKLIGGGGVKGRPLSARSVEHVHVLLQGALGWAVRMEIVGRNVCEAVTPPKVTRHEAHALSIKEAQKLLTETAEDRLGTLYALALATGMRRGELCALKWADVDTGARAATIRTSISVVGKRSFEKSTKSGRVRTVSLAQLALDTLAAQRVRQAREALAIGAAYDRSGYVFTDELGHRLSPNAVTQAFSRSAKRLALATTSFHALRHTNATLMIGSGVDPRTAASMLGHSTPSITLSIYSHVIAGAQARAADAVQARLEART